MKTYAFLVFQSRVGVRSACRCYLRLGVVIRTHAGHKNHVRPYVYSPLFGSVYSVSPAIAVLSVSPAIAVLVITTIKYCYINRSGFDEMVDTVSCHTILTH